MILCFPIGLFLPLSQRCTDVLTLSRADGEREGGPPYSVSDAAADAVLPAFEYVLSLSFHFPPLRSLLSTDTRATPQEDLLTSAQ